MTTLRLRSRTAALLALAAMALNAAWPLLANAKPQTPALEICSATGLSHAVGGTPAAPERDLHASHCTLCPFGAERFAAVPFAVQPPPPQAPVVARIFAPREAPRPALAFPFAAPPRAPPVPS